MQKDGISISKATELPTSRKFRILLVATLAVLSVQGWLGDVVNLFVAPTTAQTPPPQNPSGFFQGVASLNSLPLSWHAFEGIFLFLLAVSVLALSFKWSKSRAVRISAILGLFFVFSAALGGYLFVLSGFGAGGNSAQMGGSFIGAYALYFVALYYAK